MAAKYTLELFPTEATFKKMYEIFSTQDRPNDNAGVDLFCSTETVCPISQVTMIDLGVKARMLGPDGEPCHFWLAPRSSIWKKGVTQANSIGVIDRTYRGTLMGAVIPFQFQSATINEGDRLFQVLAPNMGHISKVIVLHESDLDETVRGSGGFGSTGR